MKLFIATFILYLSLKPSNSFLGNNIFKTGDQRLFQPFCVSDIQSLDSIGRKTHTHESITINAIKRSLLELFSDLDSDYVPPKDSNGATLTEIFQ